MSNTKFKDPVREGIMECTWSLASAVQEAGGRLRPDMMDMSLREFISTVAGQNYIRFVYTPPLPKSADEVDP